ncbi:MAG: DUF2138 family protein [Azoarcus sp.]|jgi:uncharacterized protein YfaA (DUF2138 family)|nr:DUF2138 family protein [Azoarcus sp.]
MSITKRRLFRWVLVLGAVALGISLLLHLPPFAGSVDKFEFDPNRPDALIRSDSLSRLPADLLRTPLARDVLTEDFVAYYQQDENRLALSGAVRRIAYEHKLDLPDRLIEATLDEPAEVALWRGEDGRLRDFAIVMTRNALARAIQTILPLIAKAADAQISSAGRLDGTEVDILVLEYGYRHRLLLLTKGDRVVALSNPGMLLEPDPGNTSQPWKQSKTTAKLVRELFDDDDAISPFARRFRLGKTAPGKRHELVVGSRVFAFGYDAFAPGLVALGLTFGDKGEWQSAALYDAQTWKHDENLWASLPHGPSLCANLPMDKVAVERALQKFNTRLEKKPVEDWFLNNVAGPFAVCWYKDSRLYTPLFAARLNSSVDQKLAGEFFALADTAFKAGKGEASFDKEKGVASWQGRVASSFGTPDEGNGQRSLKPALALQGNVVFFSPDAALVQNALDVAAKRYPALADSFAKTGGETLAFVAPQALAALLHKETVAALPRNEEALFRNAADAYLLPRFEALARYAPQRIKLAKGKNRNAVEWRALEWEAGNPVD